MLGAPTFRERPFAIVGTRVIRTQESDDPKPVGEIGLMLLTDHTGAQPKLTATATAMPTERGYRDSSPSLQPHGPRTTPHNASPSDPSVASRRAQRHTLWSSPDASGVAVYMSAPVPRCRTCGALPQEKARASPRQAASRGLGLPPRVPHATSLSSTVHAAAQHPPTSSPASTSEG
jgi:hypothetical protein